MIRHVSNSALRRLGVRRGFSDWRRDRRVRVEMPAEISGAPCSLEDISISGARLALQKAAAPAIGDPVRLSFTLAGSVCSVQGVVIRSSDDGLMSQIGLAFAGEQPDAIESLGQAINDWLVAAS